MTETVSYAVMWHDGDFRFVGYAEVGRDGLRLEGRGSGGREGLCTVRYEDIRRLDVHRTNGDRGLVLELPGRQPLLISSLDSPGSLGELADRIRRLTETGGTP
jgi:hypothetical protein